jgi:hypothetical protein
MLNEIKGEMNWGYFILRLAFLICAMLQQNSELIILKSFSKNFLLIKIASCDQPVTPSPIFVGKSGTYMTGAQGDNLIKLFYGHKLRIFVINLSV